MKLVTTQAGGAKPTTIVSTPGQIQASGAHTPSNILGISSVQPNQVTQVQASLSLSLSLSLVLSLCLNE